MTIGLQAKGKFAGAERTLALPAVTLTVVPPASVELAAPAHRDQARRNRSSSRGRSSARGHSTARSPSRSTACRPGLKAEPVTVAGGASSFVVKVVADAKAAATSAGTQVALAFQVEKKDYSGPARAAGGQGLAAQVEYETTGWPNTTRPRRSPRCPDHSLAASRRL